MGAESVLSKPQNTGVDIDRLRKLGLKHVDFPDNFTAHPALKKIMALRRTSIENGKGLDWPTAEALAFGSLLEGSTTVRLSGQDCERGTFSHRHAVLHVNDVAIARIEQISPFPFHLVAQEAAKYPNANIVWSQEESKNMGAWPYVQPRIASALKYINNHDNRSHPSTVCRKPSAAPATGYKHDHDAEQNTIIKETLGL